MSPMLEKIARAIGSVPIGYDEDDEFVSVPTDARQHLARAALLAMREPTDLLISVSPEDWDRKNDYEKFTAMIDAILKEPAA